jgi:hypothetical protein
MFCNTSSLGAFYSRRIGRAPQLYPLVNASAAYAEAADNAPILAAAKITGRTDGGFTVGILNAVTGQESTRFRASADGIEDIQVVEPLSNYFVARLKKDFRGGASTFGGIVTSAIRSTDDPLVRDHLRGHAEAVGVDWYHTWGGRQYSWMGSTLASSVTGSPEAMARTQRSSARYFQRPDRAVTGDGLFDARYDPTATSLQGYGLFTRVAKDAGKLRWEAMTNVRSPGFETNDLAFLDRADYVWLNGNIAGSWTTPTRWYRSVFALIGGSTENNFDGDRTRAGLQAFLGTELPNFWGLRLMAMRNGAAYDDRRTRGGPVVKRPGSDVGSVQLSTDARAPVVFDVQVQASRGVDADTRSLSIRPGVAIKPASHVFIQLSPGYSYQENDAQYVTAVQDPTAEDFFGTRYVFGRIRTRTLSLSTRANWTFTPDLTLQLFAQPFIASGEYSSFREFAAPRSLDMVVYGEDAGAIRYDEETRIYRVDPDAGGPAAPFSFRNPDFTTTALRGTAVLRWQYRPGSALFFVWTQQRSGYDPSGSFDLAGAGGAIFGEPPLNVFQIKATYWFGR